MKDADELALTSTVDVHVTGSWVCFIRIAEHCLTTTALCLAHTVTLGSCNKGYPVSDCQHHATSTVC
jgi:hypothetical protein